MIWKSLNGNTIELPIVNAVEQAILHEKSLGHKLKICIGTDSQVKSAITYFATVIVFIREKRGGYMYIHRERSTQQLSLKQRMITEVAKSIDIAYRLCDLIDSHNVALEVHADINTDPNFGSNVALKEAMGYILGMGFEFKAKPDAFASTSCADKCVA